MIILEPCQARTTFAHIFYSQVNRKWSFWSPAKPRQLLCTLSDWEVNRKWSIILEPAKPGSLLRTLSYWEVNRKWSFWSPAKPGPLLHTFFIHKLTENDHFGALPSQDNFCVHFLIYLKVNRKRHFGALPSQDYFCVHFLIQKLTENDHYLSHNSLSWSIKNCILYKGIIWMSNKSGSHLNAFSL